MRTSSYIVLGMIALLGANLANTAPAAQGATVTGDVLVMLDGKPTKPGDVKDVYVYLEEAKPTRRPGTGVTGTITQRGLQFEPHVLVVPLGATISFPNEDKTEHNVFSPPVRKWVGFDLQRYGKDPKGKAKLFLEAGEFDIYCDLHKDMWAKIKVVPSLHAQPVINGDFAITGLPPGRYRVAAWAPNSVDVKSEWFDLGVGQAVNVPQLHLQTNPRPETHLDKSYNDYRYKE